MEERSKWKEKKTLNNLTVYNLCLILGCGLVAVHVALCCINYQSYIIQLRAQLTINQISKEGKAGFFDLKTTPHLNSAAKFKVCIKENLDHLFGI